MRAESKDQRDPKSQKASVSQSMQITMQRHNLMCFQHPFRSCIQALIDGGHFADESKVGYYGEHFNFVKRKVFSHFCIRKHNCPGFFAHFGSEQFSFPFSSSSHFSTFPDLQTGKVDMHANSRRRNSIRTSQFRFISSSSILCNLLLASFTILNFEKESNILSNYEECNLNIQLLTFKLLIGSLIFECVQCHYRFVRCVRTQQFFFFARAFKIMSVAKKCNVPNAAETKDNFH